MRHTFKLLLIVTLLSYTISAALAGDYRKIKQGSRTTIILAEAITMQLLQNAALQMVEEKGPVTIYIDSPGGDYTAAKLFGRFLKARKEQGLHTTCFAGPNVMSAAYYIYLHCDSRFALKTSILFPHKIHVWFSTPIDGLRLIVEGVNVVEEQARWDGQAQNITGMNEEDYRAFRDSDNSFWSIEKIQLLSKNKWFEVVDGYILNLNAN